MATPRPHDHERACPGRTTRCPLAERVELLLAAMTLEEKVAQLGSRWVGNDMADAVGAPRTSDLNVAPMQDVFAASGTVPLEEASRHGLGHLTRVYGSVPVTVDGGRGRAGPPAARRPRRLAARHPGAGPRGVPDRVHHVRRDRLPGRDRLGRDLRPRAGRADGRRDRPRHGRRSACTRASRRCSTSSATTAGAGSRRPSGEDPYLVAMLGAAYVRGLQSAGRHRHPEALRRLLGLPRRPATTARCRWAGASCST